MILEWSGTANAARVASGDHTQQALVKSSAIHAKKDLAFLLSPLWSSPT